MPLRFDLLALVNNEINALSGPWGKDQKGLITTTTETDHSRLQRPHEPCYVEVRWKRLVGSGALVSGLVAGGRQVIAVVDSWPSREHGRGLQLLDGKEPIGGKRW
ncbi:hypothetical protein R5W24_000824 [Gemmata sp. JC717]|uniref:Uncharacterized protein n=1 Tax=Gemmata algarum TaxID=2975278 RepID=A0ABU5F909_9BACT|nr:hypothetical protein [Gemmata algarum]MDY3551745.1 hypothetical protein [Gemmata algarum]MDY3563689.1 hypothetical protein [Gemmata algarum]